MIPIVVAVTVIALAAGQASAAEVSYFDVSRGAHPHDVAPAPDGNVWYTAQSQGALGILNPKTGQATQISLGKGAAPHGVIVGPDRAAWITEGGQNAIARFPTPTSTRRPSTARAFSGSPDRTASMAASIRRTEKSKPGKRRRATVPTGSPRRRTVKSGTRRSPATISPRSIP